MEVINGLSNLYSHLQASFSSGSSAVINHILQAYFFSAAISNLVSMMLKMIQFAYADVIADSKIIFLFGILAMWYLKIWDYYSGALYILSVFSMAIVSLYVYDFCGNISERFDNWRLHNRDWALISSFVLMFVSTSYVFYAIHNNTSNALKYEYSGIYLLMVLIILVGNMLRKRSVIYTLIGILIMNYLIASRYLISINFSETTLAFAKIPFATIPYFMMALHA